MKTDVCETDSKCNPRRIWNGFRQNEGNAVLETALTMPIVLLILTGIFYFSIALFQKMQLAEAVSVAGRYLAVDRGDTDPCKSTATQLYSAAPGFTQSKLTLTFTLNGTVTNGATCPGSGGLANANMVSGATAQVEATYPCTLSFFTAFGNKISTTCSLTSEVTELIQ
jgi:Flp pilus assembly protein TadG